MHEIILCKLGEVVLKGLNRRSFEMKLMSNIRRRTQRFGKFRIYSRQSTIYVEPAEETCGHRRGLRRLQAGVRHHRHHPRPPL